MPFELSLTGSLPATLRAIAAERLDLAASALAPGLNDAAVHDARKRLKELRALLRLMRKPLPRATRRRENAAFRDLARPLSDLRDAAVLLSTLDALTADSKLFRPSLAPLRAALQKSHRIALAQLRRSPAARALRSALASAIKRTTHWPLSAPANPDPTPLLPGLRASYRAGRRAMKTALADPTDDHLHEWRKRAKDLRYHLELLTPLDAPRLLPLAEHAKTLTDHLGTDHDLAVLHALLTTTHAKTLPPKTHAALESQILKRRRHLQKQSRHLGRKLYAHKPKRFVNDLKLASL